MRRIKLLIFTIAVFISFGISGKELKRDTAEYKYKTAIVYQANGPVKQIKQKTKDPLKAFGKESFDSNGKIKDCIGLSYDSLGYLKSFGIGWNIGKFGMNVEGDIEYNQYNLPVVINIKTDVFKKFNAVYEYRYTDGILTGKTVTYQIGEEKGRIEYLYTAQEYDSHGSWIKRYVTLTEYDEAGDKTKEKEFEETRQIDYFY